MEAEIEETEWVQARYDQLNFIEEKRLKALCYGQCYQKRMARAFDKRVNRRRFNEGDLVLKKVLSFKEDWRGKFKPNYEGPYLVNKVLSGVSLILSEMGWGCSS